MIELRMLGGVELRTDEARAPEALLAHPKRVALLAYLSAARPFGFRQRDLLVALLWPNLDQEHARGALRKTLYHLRQSIGAGVIVARGDEMIGIDTSELWCDVRALDEALRAEQPEAALALYRGDFLPGMFVADAPEFERWLDSERRELRAMAVRAAWLAAERAEQLGDAERCADCARQAVKLAPDDEQGTRRLIALLERLGDRAGAVRAYERFEDFLAAELQVAPSMETAALIAQVRTNVPAPAATRTATRRPNDAPNAATEATGDGAPRKRAVQRGAFVSGAVTLAVASTLLATNLARSRAGPSAIALDRSRVAVSELSNQTGRPDLDFIGLEAQDWITRGLQQTGIVRVFALGSQVDPGSAQNAARPSAAHKVAESFGVGLLVGGRYYLLGDSIHLDVQITAVGDGKVIATLDPVIASVTDPTAAIDTLRQRVVGALAPHVDPALREWASFASKPPSFEAYREFSLGLKAFYRDDFEGAIRHSMRAGAFDSSYVYPLLFAASLRGEVETTEFPAADSLLRIVRGRHLQLAPFDEAYATNLEANLAGEIERAFEASQELRKYVSPGSSWELDAVAGAVALNRPSEALAIARTIDVNREAEMDHWNVFVPIGNAYHLAGEDSIMLTRFQREAVMWQDIPLVVIDQMRGLAALARPLEAESLWRAFVRRRPQAVVAAMWLAAWGAAELRTHGSRDEARRLASEALSSLPALPDSSKAFGDPLVSKMKVLREAGREREAWLIARRLATKHPERAGLWAASAALAVRVGDSATARQIDARLASRHGDKSETREILVSRARIAAALGMRDSALAHLHAACDHGCEAMEDIHVMLEFDALRSYAPFREFLRPRR